LFRGIWISSCLRGFIQSLMLASSLHALAWPWVEQNLLDLQHSRCDRIVCLELNLTCKVHFTECFGQFISKHYFSRVVSELDISRLNRLTREVVPSIDMLCWAWTISFLAIFMQAWLSS
jgi:hypothetical protein